MNINLINHYETSPKPLQFIRDVGIVCQESIVLNGKVDDYVVIVRKEKEVTNFLIPMKNIVLILILMLGFSLNAQVGINTDNPQSTLDINGNLSIKVVNLNGGPSGAATEINDGVYLSLTPTAFNVEFILPDATLVPGRIYILRNVSDAENAVIYTFGSDLVAGNGVEFFRGDGRTSLGPNTPVTMTPDTAGDNNDPTKTLIFVSDGANWTYGTLGL